MEQCSKNADISILSNFLATLFPNFFLNFEKFAKCYLHAKFQIDWTIQTKITGGGQAIAICKKPGLFRVKFKCNTYYIFSLP